MKMEDDEEIFKTFNIQCEILGSSGLTKDGTI